MILKRPEDTMNIGKGTFLCHRHFYSGVTEKVQPPCNKFNSIPVVVSEFIAPKGIFVLG